MVTLLRGTERASKVMRAISFDTYTVSHRYDSIVIDCPYQMDSIILNKRSASDSTDENDSKYLSTVFVILIMAFVVDKSR